MEIETEKLKILEKLGLTENQAKVYLALLRLGSVTAGIIIKETGLHRAYVYEILEKLMDKGLVSHVIQAQRKYFEAANPKKFLEMISEEKQNIQEKEQEIKKNPPSVN
ncbi:MAG: helix-turn-helix domain-containing protein [Candidatus Pacearchaeota archaeon]|nr:helix-turn-helix domain-containing protein [Candidatus Pacearchaeota archaeon]